MPNKLTLYIIEIFIALRLGMMFPIQMMNLIKYGDIETSSIYSTLYKYVILAGFIFCYYVAYRYKLFHRVNGKYLWFVGFVALYFLYISFYLFIDPRCPYSPAARSGIENKVLNNILLVVPAMLVMLIEKINHKRIVFLFLLINFVCGIAYLKFFNIDFGESYDGFLAQTLGFSSLQIGYLYGLCICLSVYLLSFAKKNIFTTFSFFIAFLLFGYLLISSGKTGPLIFTFFILLLEMKCLFFKKMRLTPFFVVSLVLLALSFLFKDFLIDTVAALNPNLALKLHNMLYNGDTSNRLPLYSNALDLFFESPIWGNYFSLNKNLGSIENIYPHNFFLESLITWGILGTSFLLWMLKYCFNVFIHMMKTGSDRIWIGFTWIFGLLSAQTTGSIYGQYRMWLCFAAMIVFYSCKKHFQVIK